MSRTRTRIANRSYSGNAKRVLAGTTIIDTNQAGSSEVFRSACIDVVGNKQGDNPLSIEKWTKSYTNLNGRIGPDALNYREYTDFDCHFQRPYIAHLNITLPSGEVSMSTAMARTNPSRPVVSIPTFIAELKDFPSLVRSAGRRALILKGKSKNLQRKGKLKEAADTYLEYKFAINPLIQDLKKMSQFQYHEAQRLNELDRLYSKGGLRRRVTIATEVTDSNTSGYVIASNLGIILTVRVHTITKASRWVTLRWRPTTPPPFADDKSKRELARNLIYGLNAHSLVSTAWELLPWSWMIDWFTNTQDWIQSTNNTVPAEAVNRCVMTSIETTASMTRSDTNHGFTGGQGVFTHSSKSRGVGVANTIGASFPLFSGNQLSILGALSVSRGSR